MKVGWERQTRRFWMSLRKFDARDSLHGLGSTHLCLSLYFSIYLCVWVFNGGLLSDFDDLWEMTKVWFGVSLPRKLETISANSIIYLFHFFPQKYIHYNIFFFLEIWFKIAWVWEEKRNPFLQENVFFLSLFSLAV